MHGTCRLELTSWITKVKLEQGRDPDDAGDADTDRTLANPESLTITSPPKVAYKPPSENTPMIASF